MYFQSDDHRVHVLAKLSLIALYIILAYDVAMVALGYFLAQANDINSSGSSSLHDVVFLIAVADMIAIFIVKKIMLGRAVKAQEKQQHYDEVYQYKKLFNITLVITIMCLAITTYGLILVILGEKFEILILFVAMSLIGYQFFRLRPRDFKDEFPPADKPDEHIE